MSDEIHISRNEELAILAYVTRKDFAQLQLNKPILTQMEQEQVEQLLALRLEGVPLPYILGEVEFYDVRLLINQNTLIPRPETELLAERIIQVLSEEVLKGKRALDLCAGAGGIGLSVKKHFPDLQVTLSDISSLAMEIAQKNSELNRLDVECTIADLFEGMPPCSIDYLFCNPPYISLSDYYRLDESVRKYEPKQALVGGEDGTLFYKRIAAEGPAYLCPGAKLFFEIGYDQKSMVKEIFSSSCWKNLNVVCDYAGHPRFFFLEFSSQGA